MTHLDLKINNNRTIEISIVDNWDELNRNQVLYIAKHLPAWRMMLLATEVSMQKARALLLIELIVNKTPAELKEICELFSKYDFEGNDINLLSITDFVFQKNGLVLNKIPDISISATKKIYGPADRLDNISIHEFSFAINYFNLYNTTKDEMYLDYLVCVLYRVKSAGGEERGDIREPFNMYTADKYLKEISKLDYSYKEAIYLFFQGCLESWLIAFPLVFKRGTEEQKTSATQKTFLDIILNISGGKFGTFNETKNENAYLVLKDLNTELIEKPKPKA